LNNTFICDFNSFKGIIKKIPSGIIAFDKNEITGEIPSEFMDNNRITSKELIGYLKVNQHYPELGIMLIWYFITNH
jgi:hypothetical protein